MVEVTTAWGTVVKDHDLGRLTTTALYIGMQDSNQKFMKQAAVLYAELV